MRRAIVLLTLTLVACVSRATPSAPSLGSSIVVPTTFPNGRVEITVESAYTLGVVATFPVAVGVTRGTITGPVAARVMASGINEGGLPSEVLVRTLAVSPVTVSAGQRRTTSVSWDGRDEQGILVPADAYSLVLELRVVDGGAPRSTTAGATVQMNEP